MPSALERLLAAAKGEVLDRKPIVVWSASPGHRADAIVVPHVEVRHARETHPDQVVLAEVLSPFGRSIGTACDLNALLESDPGRGSAVLESFVRDTKQEISEALAWGAQGIFYRLDGAYPAATTPMEYGGHYLEVDREVLAGIREGFSLVFLEGEGDVYFDFVSDLPGNAMGWDAALNPIDLDEARKHRTGALALDHPQAEIVLTTSLEQCEEWLDRLAVVAYEPQP